MVDQEPVTNLGVTTFGDGWRPERVAVAPGRIELLGNHVDYNGGVVLAGAIDRVIRAVASTHDDKDTIRLYAPDVSTDVVAVQVRGPAMPGDDESSGPAGYLAGIVQALHDADIHVRGGQAIVVSGDVPVGFGMSSSAALCVSLTMLLAETQLPDREIVAIARRAEHLTGAPVGAMDQSASVAGGIILFDGTDASVERLDPALGDHVFAVANSGVHHTLSESQYPARVRESRDALDRINRHLDPAIGGLGELDMETWTKIRDDVDLPDPLPRRVDHVVSEVGRVREGVQAIRTSGWERFGELMTASGRSSATDYEISHPDVEELVALLVEQEGVLGARMMGGGEGGPALALLHRDAVDGVRSALDSRFFTPRGLDAESAFEVCRFGPGARLEVLNT